MCIMSVCVWGGGGGGRWVIVHFETFYSIAVCIQQHVATHIIIQTHDNVPSFSVVQQISLQPC